MLVKAFDHYCEKVGYEKSLPKVGEWLSDTNPNVRRAVTGYFDYIEDLIERENTFNMNEFSASVNEFLAFRKYDILPDKGKISKAKADQKAETEYLEFNKTQKIISDFDKEIKRLKENPF